MPRRLSRRTLVLALLAPVLLAAPGEASARAQAGGGSTTTKALARAQRDLAAVRKRRVAVCRHRRSAACRRLKAQERRRAAAVAALRTRRRHARAGGSPAAPASALAAPTAGTGASPSSTAGSPPAAGSAPAAGSTPAAGSAPAAGWPPAAAPISTPLPPQTGATLYVAQGGSDTGPGTASDPLATLTAALARAAGGERIVVGPGRYPRATDQRTRTRTVTVVGPGDGSATVAGMTVAGGQELDVRGLRFTAIVAVLYHTSKKLAQPARDVAFHDDEFTAPAGSGCLTARNGVQGLTITDSRIHDCVTGFGAAAGGVIPQSSGLTLARNRFEHFTTDAIQFGQWHDVEITGNTIDDISDPAKTIHNDGIQLTGNSTGVTIAGNRITNSRDQLIFIQDAVGPIDDVVVEDNLLYGAGAVAIQSQGATRARFAANTVWRVKDGGLWLTQGYSRGAGTPVVPTDTVVTDNVLQTYRRLGGARTASAAGNVGLCLTGQRPGTDAASGWTCLTALGFVDAAHDDYRLRPDSPVRALGTLPGALR